MNPFLAFTWFDQDNPLPDLKHLSPAAKERLIVLGAIILVTLVVILWAAVVRKRRRSAHDLDRHRGRGSFHEAKAGAVELQRMIQTHSRRRRRHRPANPTLAQTGGLPPVRRENQDSSAQS